MISLIRAAWQTELRVPMFVGKSTDGYPSKDDPAMKNGARCYHMDTGKEWEYSESDDHWYQVPSGGGGGASSWDDLLNKPFETIGDGLSVNDDDELVANVVNDITSTSTTDALSAHQGKLLSDRINNLEARGRFLALLNTATGMPATQPQAYPYEFKTGDYFIINAIAAEGQTNYMPSGTTYSGGAFTTPYTGDVELAVGSEFWFDGTNWNVLAGGGGGKVDDVQVNGVSVVSDAIANIPLASTSDYGVIKTNPNYATAMSNGNFITQAKTVSQYESAGNGMFVGKGTLENVLTNRVLSKLALSCEMADGTTKTLTINGSLT